MAWLARTLCGASVCTALLLGCNKPAAHDASHAAPVTQGPPATQVVSPDHARASTSPESKALATLTVTVTDLRNHKGQLVFGVFTSADGFPTDSTKAVDWQVKPADADSVVFTAKLPPGTYGASVLHDENKNGKMDKDFAGVPKEGYGVTNNPKPALRAATFKESTFTLPPQGAEMTISLQYFK